MTYLSFQTWKSCSIITFEFIFFIFPYEVLNLQKNYFMLVFLELLRMILRSFRGQNVNDISWNIIGVNHPCNIPRMNKECKKKTEKYFPFWWWKYITWRLYTSSTISLIIIFRHDLDFKSWILLSSLIFWYN